MAVNNCQNPKGYDCSLPYHSLYCLPVKVDYAVEKIVSCIK